MCHRNDVVGWHRRANARGFLACLPWLLPDNPQKVFIEVPSAFGAGSKIGCFGPASFCVFGEKRRPGKGRFLAAQATLQDEKTGVK
jgi:hypothetical protein